jgi:hypothetical protein
MSTVLLVLSAFGPPPRVFEGAIARGALATIKQTEMQDGDLEAAAGVITTMHLDQVDFAARTGAITRLLDRGGHIAFMGHLERAFLPELSTFVPLRSARPAELALEVLAPHSIFDGVSRSSLATRRGVAGFYGRGHVPPPSGALALTGVGPERVPIDWVWSRPKGGALFLHAGNDIWTIAEDGAINRLLAERLVRWCAGELPTISLDAAVENVP